jgi:hypothetical protein
MVEDFNGDGNSDFVALYDDVATSSISLTYGPSLPVNLPTSSLLSLDGDVLDRGGNSSASSITAEGVVRCGFLFPPPASGPRYRDIVVPKVNSGSTGIWVLRNPGAGSAPVWAPALQSQILLSNVSDVALADMDNDGLEDLITLHRYVSLTQGSEIQVFWNRSALGVPLAEVFTQSSRTRFPLGASGVNPQPRLLEVLKSHGTKRIAYADYNSLSRLGSAHVITLSTRGAAVPSFTVASSISLQGVPAAMMAHDFDGDGVDDLAIGCQDLPSAGIEVQLMLANGTPASALQNLGSLNVRDFAAIDVNGDNVKDLLAVEEALATAQDLAAYEFLPVSGLFRGAGRIASGTNTSTGNEWMSQTVSVAAGVLGGQGGEGLAVGGNPDTSPIQGGLVLMSNNVQSSWGLSGNRCGGLNWPAVSLVQQAYTGANYQFDISGAPAGSAATLVAVGFTNFAGPLDVVGMPGCWAYCRTDMLVLLPSASQQPARFSLSIPADPIFRGLRFFQQAAVHAPGLNAQSLATSQLVSARIL